MTDHRSTLEHAIIGAMLLEGRAIDTATRYGITSDWFADTTARNAATAIFARHASGGVDVDPITIGRDANISHDWLCDQIDKSTPSMIDGYCTDMSGYHDLAKLDMFARQVGSAINGAKPEDAKAIKAKVESDLHRMLTNDARTSQTLRAAAHEWLDRMTASDEACTLLDWPVRCVTDAIGRIDREVIWLLAQPSIGKTAFVLQHLLLLAQQGHIASLASLESAADSIASRVVANLGGLDTYPIRQRHAAPETIAAARAAADKIPDEIHVSDEGMTLDQCYAWGRAEKRKGAKILMIDNTRHVRVPGGDSRVDNTAAMSSRFKQLRDDTSLPVVVLHHSAIDKKTGKEDASWSQDIRRDADMMIFLREDAERSTPPAYAGGSEICCVTVDVEKNREGRKNTRTDLEFIKPLQRFVKWER